MLVLFFLVVLLVVEEAVPFSVFFLLVPLTPHPSPSSVMNCGVGLVEEVEDDEEEVEDDEEEEMALKSMLLRMYSTTLTVTALPSARIRCVLASPNVQLSGNLFFKKNKKNKK